MPEKQDKLWRLAAIALGTLCAFLALGIFFSWRGVSAWDCGPSSSLTPAEAYCRALKINSVEGSVYGASPTRSMLPVIDSNTYVAVEPAKIGDIQRGDIIAFRKPDGALVCHAVFEVREGRVWTCGYNSPRADRVWVTKNNLFGRVNGVVWAQRKEGGP